MRTERATSAPVGARSVEGPSFPILLKIIATLVLGALILWGFRTWDVLRTAELGPGGIGFLTAVIAVIATGYWGILFSRTCVDRDTIRQRWLWTKEVRLVDVTQLKFIYVPGLAWLLVPRLVVRTRGLGVVTFQAGDAQLVAAFRELAYGP